jgi:hypothetical protein
MPYDYTDAPLPPKIELIPANTIATVVLHIRTGNAGEDGVLKRSKNGACEMLDCEFVVADGPHKGRKFWEYLIIRGTTDGQAQVADGSKRTLKAILDSALGLKPDDVSPEARAARTVSLKQFEGMTFIAKIGEEKGGPIKNKPGEFYPDKNILAGVITPDKAGWKPVEQPPPFNGGGSSAPSAAATLPVSAPIAKPGWAREAQ